VAKPPTRKPMQLEWLAQSILDAIEDPIYVIGADFTVIHANRSARELPSGDPRGRACYAAVAGQDHPCAGCPPQTGGVMPRRAPTRAGGRVYQIHTYPIRDETRGFQGIIEYARDVTAERLLEVQVAHQERMASLGLMAAGLAHEIGNPLAAMSSLVQLAQRRGATALTADQLGILRTHMDRIGRIVHDVSNFGRPANREPARLSLNKIAETAASLIRFDPRCRGIEMRLELAEILPAVELVEDQILQVCVNLLVNALDAMPDGGVLVIATASREGEVELSVSDTGRGVPAQLTGRIFEPFFTTKEPGRGTGLGLSVSYGLVRRFGGRIDVESPPGKGSTFRVILPLRTPAPAR